MKLTESFKMKPETPEDIKRANEQAEALAEMLATDEGFKQLGEEAYQEAKRQEPSL